MAEQKRRIVVCSSCGTIYDLHYIDEVIIHKNTIEKFNCKNCGMIPITYSNQFVLKNENGESNEQL